MKILKNLSIIPEGKQNYNVRTFLGVRNQENFILFIPTVDVHICLYKSPDG